MVELARVWMARPWLQLLAVEAVAVEVAVASAMAWESEGERQGANEMSMGSGR